MRVISGSARSRRLTALEGLATRPTTDKVKEGMFNSIQFDIEGRDVLDLFAGSGQLGIEALSRGAAHCTFVDNSRGAVAVVRKNVETVGFSDRSTVLQCESLGYLASCRGRKKFDIIFLDPPYATFLLKESLEKIVGFDILHENGIIVCENTTEFARPQLPEAYRLERELRYGQIKVFVYRYSTGR